jgi:hypothetical protein
MYTNEIRNIIRQNNNKLSKNDILRIINIKDNPQINHIKYEDNKYKLWDIDGNYIEFEIIPYQKVKKR